MSLLLERWRGKQKLPPFPPRCACATELDIERGNGMSAYRVWMVLVALAERARRGRFWEKKTLGLAPVYTGQRWFTKPFGLGFE